MTDFLISPHPARVAFSIGAFVKERDHVQVGITILVLTRLALKPLARSDCMALRWVFEDREDHLVVHLEGEWLLPSLFLMFDEIAERCREVGHVRVLCDCRNVRGTLAETTKYLVGVRVAEALKTIKLAAVVAPDAHVTGFAGNVAARRGGRLFTTKSLEEARQWLLE
jgi:hypothetical protein